MQLSGQPFTRLGLLIVFIVCIFLLFLQLGATRIIVLSIRSQKLVFPSLPGFEPGRSASPDLSLEPKAWTIQVRHVRTAVTMTPLTSVTITRLTLYIYTVSHLVIFGFTKL